MRAAECPSCIRIKKDEHPDVRVLRPEGRGGQLRAEGVRDAIADVSFRPFEGRRRVIILADAERMNPTTANTLLKTLEEPPSWATLILVTANEAALLPTVLSRCQIFRFSPLAPEELETLLRSRHGIDPDRAALLAAVAGGGIARALELAEEPLPELRQQALSIATLAVESATSECARSPGGFSLEGAAADAPARSPALHPARSHGELSGSSDPAP